MPETDAALSLRMLSKFCITSVASSRSVQWSSDSFSSHRYAMEYAFMRFHSISGANAEDKRKNQTALGYICWLFTTTKNVTDEKCFAMQNFIWPTRKCRLSGRDVSSELVWCSELTTTRTRNNLIKFYGRIVTVAKKISLESSICILLRNNLKPIGVKQSLNNSRCSASACWSLFHIFESFFEFENLWHFWRFLDVKHWHLASNIWECRPLIKIIQWTVQFGIVCDVWTCLHKDMECPQQDWLQPADWLKLSLCSCYVVACFLLY